MNRLTCIAIDDEPLALLVIAQFCERKGGIELLTYSEPRIGLEEIERRKPDLVFLDIEMNNINGLAIAKELPKKCALIFTTAHAQYALEGFNLDAVDFLHKPFAYERFERAVEKAMRYLETRQPQTREEKQSETIIVKQGYNSITIPLEEIVYIEALENYVKIIRTNGSSVLSRINIKTIQEMLPQSIFLRIHRSYIISIKKVEYFSKQELKLKEISFTLPIGRRYAKEVFESLSNKSQE